MTAPLEPTEAMVDAGINELLEQIPGLEDDVDNDQLSDAVVFVWQAMHEAHNKAGN